jgi:hypothetical protein
MIGLSNAITSAVSVRAHVIAAPTCVDSSSVPAVAASFQDKRVELIRLPSSWVNGAFPLGMRLGCETTPPKQVVESVTVTRVRLSQRLAERN